MTGNSTNVEKVKALCGRTKAGVMDCRKALEYADGDLDKAEKVIWRQRQRQGLDRVDTPAGKAGVVHAYVHQGDRIGSMVEVLCDTDFAARTEEFKSFAHDLALHIAAENPEWRALADIAPIDFAAMDQDTLSRRCLLTQPHVKDPSHTVGELLNELSAKLGENCHIGRFQRWEVADSKMLPVFTSRRVVPVGWNGRGTDATGIFIAIGTVLVLVALAVMRLVCG